MKTIAEIKAIRDKMQAEIIDRDKSHNKDIRIIVGMATCGIAAGARPVFNTLVDEVAKRKLVNVKVSRTGCLGMCKLEPIVEVYTPNDGKVTYIRVTPEKILEIIDKHIVGGNVCTQYLVENE
ncbi:MAG: (2Fe-2S) ferredoxin domain-containing protein [Clostridia bacterium]|nr:(2Fe-2S) ferredoxin domain-containing protein [Clostridia bacterium]